jgi:flagellar hook-associated protein 1 FlgK
MIRSTFLGIEIGLSGLLAARGGLDTTGHNISNASTPGYSRQRVNLNATFPLNFPGAFVTLRPGQIGTGVQITGIERIRSQFIEAQIHSQNGNQNMFQQLSDVFKNVESVIGEPSDTAINGLMGNFFNAWGDLSNDPSSAAARTQLVQATQQLTDFVNGVDRGLKDQIANINEQLAGKVSELNGLASQVAEVNRQIMIAQGDGSNPAAQANDLMDARDMLISRISQIVNARVIYTQGGGVSVLIQGHPLVQNEVASKVSLNPNPADPLRPVAEFSASRIPLEVTSGELAGLTQMRDIAIPAVQKGLQQVMTAFVNRVNEVHLNGYGLDGQTGRAFFTDTETRRFSGTALAGTTTLDTTLDQLGISSGDFFVQGQRITISDEEVKAGTAITLRELVRRIEEPNIDVRVTLDTSLGYTRLQIGQWNPIDGNVPLTIKSGNSNFLNVTGLAGAQLEELHLDPPYQNSMYGFSLNPAIRASTDAIAAAGNDGLGFPGPGDNRNALAIAALQNDNTAIYGSTFQEYYQSAIGALGSQAQAADNALNSSTLALQQLTTKQQEISGVNLDEEATNLIKYQKAFEANSRVITTMDEAIETIITRMGVVGR